MAFTPDPSQQAVIDSQRGYHLVLAPPGCGKTHILTARIMKAYESGVDYQDMLCLTFTNRAARGMKERILQNISDREVERVYVGNVHRFCSRFLFENALIPAGTSVIDDDDAISILARFMDDDEAYVAVNYKRRREYFDAIHLAAFMFQIEHGHSKNIRLHPECLTVDDITTLKQLCQFRRCEFTREFMLDVYKHADTWRDVAREDNIDYGLRKMLEPLLRKFEAACFYAKYKQTNNLLDFEDLLLLSYEALIADKAEVYKRYPWIQVDEVQDLNPLQLRIIDLLTDTRHPCLSVVYLGDEQQAIFSFMGAKMGTLQLLKERCKDNIHKLSKNHRSPKYLLQVFNHYAYHMLGIEKDMLPTSDSEPLRVGNELTVFCSNSFDNEYADAAQQAQRINAFRPEETTAVIVTSNGDADIISNRMDMMHLKHFKVSGTDMFSLPEVKLVLAHLSVFANEHNFIAWARLLKGMRVYEQNAAARNFVRELMDRALLPTDLLMYDKGSYVINFVERMKEREFVVFDTETTGLNVAEDDIVQIAAMKMKGGEVVANSEFKVFIKTDREIPLMLGDIENPIIEEMKHHTLLRHDEALRLFMDYVGDAVLLGHNADYDYNILDANLKRYLPEVDLHEKCPEYFDTLKLARLLEPHLHQYKLKHLLEVLHLEGENSHLADADVAATCNVVNYCFGKAQEVIPQQREFLSQRNVRERAEVLRRRYQSIFEATRQALYLLPEEEGGGESAVVKELRQFYDHLLVSGYITEVKGFEYLLRYVDKELVDKQKEPLLRDQIANHVLEMSTLKESDLCTNDIVDEKVFVTTVHKAKGLEFDNVIVFDVTDDRYPGFFSKDNPLLVEEDKRKLYVALTRARKSIMIMASFLKHDSHNRPHERMLSPFLTPIIRFFRQSPESKA